MIRTACILLSFLFLLMPVAASAEDVGLIVALKGQVSVTRDAKISEARLKDKIFRQDILETGKASRLKLLFKDDSILTLAEKTRVVVRDYLSSADRERGKSIFTLMDGKLRSLVGGNAFEIHTPTVVVSARGTYFITWTWTEGGIPASGVAVMEGAVDVRNSNPEIAGVVRIERGTMSTIRQNNPPDRPVPVPPAVMKELLEATELQGMPRLEKKMRAERKTLLRNVLPLLAKEGMPLLPPITNQIPPRMTPVRIIIPIPEGL